MSNPDQSLIFADAPVPGSTSVSEDERAARASLRAQIARLEHELSAILCGGFPYLASCPAPSPAVPAGGPRLRSLGELELTRDRLAISLQQMRARAAARAQRERRAHELLRRMKLEPGRYRYARLPVSDLGEAGCGVWEVRPRFGLIGMLAGWWQLTLS